jgi:hypothetical protein
LYAIPEEGQVGTHAGVATKLIESLVAMVAELGLIDNDASVGAEDVTVITVEASIVAPLSVALT